LDQVYATDGLTRAGPRNHESDGCSEIHHVNGQFWRAHGVGPLSSTGTYAVRMWFIGWLTCSLSHMQRALRIHRPRLAHAADESIRRCDREAWWCGLLLPIFKSVVPYKGWRKETGQLHCEWGKKVTLNYCLQFRRKLTKFQHSFTSSLSDNILIESSLTNQRIERVSLYQTCEIFVTFMACTGSVFCATMYRSTQQYNGWLHFLT